MKQHYPVVAARAATIAFATVLTLGGLGSERAGATDLAPPLLDVARLCDVSSRHNMRAMSECVVAESEARAQMLQNWSRYSNAAAGKCIKEGRKAKRMPYGVMTQCLAAEEASAVPVQVTARPGSAPYRTR